MCVSPTHAEVLFGTNELASVEKAADQHDLLIIGAPPDRTIAGRFFGTAKDKLTRNATCSVLWLKTPRSQTHAAFDVTRQAVQHDFELMDYLVEDCVKAKIELTKKEDIFRMVTEVFADQYDHEISPGIIATALWEREQMQNTAVGRGVAMPHGTLSRAPSGRNQDRNHDDHQANRLWHPGWRKGRYPVHHGRSSERPADSFADSVSILETIAWHIPIGRYPQSQFVGRDPASDSAKSQVALETQTTTLGSIPQQGG